MPIARASYLTCMGAADVWFVARQSPDRDEFAIHTNEHVGQVRVGVFVLNDSIFDPADKTLVGKQVMAAVRGTASHDFLKRLNPKAVATSNEKQLVYYLRFRQIEGIYYTFLPVIHTARKLGLKLRHHVVDETVNYLYFNKELVRKYPDLIPALDPHICTCRKAGIDKS